MKTKEKAPIRTTVESGQGCEDLLTREQAAVMVAKAVRKVRTEEAEHAKLLVAWWSEKLEEIKQEAKELQKDLEYHRAQNTAMLVQIQTMRRTHKRNLDDTIECCEALRWNLRKERKEREAAQRTVALLGGGIDE